MPNFCICISVFACICVCLHVFECVCLCVNLFMSVCVVCRPKVDVRPKVSFSIFFSLYFFKIKSPTEPGAQGLSQATRPISPRGAPVSTSSVLGFQTHAFVPGFDFEVQPLVLMPGGGFFLTEHLPCERPL